MERDRIPPKSDIHLSALGINYSTFKQLKTVIEKLASLLSEMVTSGHLFKFLGQDFLLPIFRFCKEKRYQEIPKKIPEEMQGAKALPLVDCQYLHALLKGNDGLHIYNDVVKMSFESTLMAMATKMEMPALLVISQEADQNHIRERQMQEVH